MENISTQPIEPSLQKQFKGHRNSITALVFNPNEKQLASCSLDNSILLWDLQGSMRSYRFQGHDEAVMDVTFSPSGKYMASASRDKTIRLWIPTVTGSTGVFKAHSQTIRSVQFSPDNSKILTASDDKIIKLWSSNKLKFVASYVGHTNWVRRASMSHDGSLIASCSDDRSIRIWNVETGECIHTYKDKKGYGLYLSWHPSSCYVAVATSYGSVTLYDVRTHNLLQYYSVHNDAVTQLTFHPSGSYILTASKDGKMKILDLLEGHPIFTLNGHGGPVNAACFSPSGNDFATGGDDKLVFLWNTNFTDLAIDLKENVRQNAVSSAESQRSTKSNKAGRIWYQCYHNLRYPTITFDHIDEPQFESTRMSDEINIVNNNANINQNEATRSTSTPMNITRNLHISARDNREYTVNDVGDMSHIPRTPPRPTMYTLPSIVNRSVETDSKDIFGMVKLGESDVCYTSGTIEWVGRKRCFPINSGFKILSQKEINEPVQKRKRNGLKSSLECDCADVLPTVNAIVDHLNALHEAVDLVDLRLNTVEDVISKDE